VAQFINVFSLFSTIILKCATSKLMLRVKMIHAKIDDAFNLQPNTQLN